VLEDFKTKIPKINEQKRVPPDVIQSVVDHIVQTFEPEKIILFGSYAYGEPKPGSDVDLLVVMKTDRPGQKQFAAFSVQSWACDFKSKYIGANL
jgi:predicted nucleotidyltransferase